MAAKKNMSVDEVLAACRQADGGDAVASPPVLASEAVEEKVVDSTEIVAADAGKKPASTKPGEMGITDILAAARGEKAAKKPASSKPATSKPVAPQGGGAKPAPDKSSPKSPAKPKSLAPKDTTSILVAARKSAKPGPTSKAEAEAKEKAKGEVVDRGKPKVVAPPMPEKLAYVATRAVAPEPGDASRRGFFSTVAASFMGSFLAVGFTSLGATNLLWLLGLARFMFPNIRIEPPSAFRVGFPDDFAPGQVETKFKAQFGVWIVRDEYEGLPQIFALKSVCTHLGCTPNWLEGEQKFKCPCHGSGFYKDGINFEGPAPRPLERYAIALASDGQLLVDKSKIFNEEKGQWTDGMSFVPV